MESGRSLPPVAPERADKGLGVKAGEVCHPPQDCPVTRPAGAHITMQTNTWTENTLADMWQINRRFRGGFPGISVGSDRCAERRGGNGTSCNSWVPGFRSGPRVALG